MLTPLVSIIIPCYNYAQYLPDAIKSCLAQTHTNFEILVVDDGSGDDTSEVVRAFPEARYIYQDHRGVASARNRGWGEAHGQFLQFLDADDVLLPSKIEECLTTFAEHPEFGVVYTDYEVRTPDLTGRSVIQRPNWEMPEGEILQRLIKQSASYFVPACALIARPTVERLGGFNEQLAVVEDWFFWVNLAANGVLFGHIPKALAWYRDTPGSLSKQETLIAYCRLKAYEDLRALPIPRNLLNLDDALADRHHVLASKLWKYGEVAEARKHFMAAFKLQKKGRIARLLLLSLCGFTSLETAEKIFAWIKPNTVKQSR
ncbi:MAG TPA: glycosyltransferase [Aggregatilineales bacterium]|nr:glycosyltransferase [Aggregatilineales bacterium]